MSLVDHVEGDVREVRDRITRVVMARMSAEASRRSADGLSPLNDTARQALASATVAGELLRIDQERREQGRPALGEAVETQITNHVMAQTTGLAWIDVALSDPSVEEVACVRHDQWFTYHSDGSVEFRPDLGYRTDRELRDWLAFIARTKGRTERQFNAQHPLLVMRVGAGLRLAATCEVSQATSFTLRRNTLGVVRLADLVRLEMFPQVLGDLFAAMIRAPEIRVVVVGATAAGKTTLSRAMLSELPPDFRLLVIEDTAELDLYDPVLHRNVESWEHREANSEGQGEVSLGDLVRHGLRYRPDLLMVGETRGSEAAVPMLAAMTHGQASMTTVHAESAVGGLDKLALYLATGDAGITLEKARYQLSAAVDFVIHVDRGSSGQRIVTEVREVVGFEGEQILTNVVYESDGQQWRTFGRLGRTGRKLERVGFDLNRMGGGFGG